MPDARGIATEQELLDFVNAIRGIGGGNILDALLPGIAGSAGHCLVAQNLNFHCTVAPADGIRSGVRWGMMIRDGADLIERIAKTLSLEINPYHDEELLLPDHITNAARAFDAGTAFKAYTAANPCPPFLSKERG